MKYNPITKQLFTKDNRFIRQLHCPLGKHWEQLTPASNLQAKICNTCQKAVLDTSLLKDEEVLKLVSNDPHTCLKVDLNQSNLTITYHEHI